jgi:hypothetical protein
LAPLVELTVDCFHRSIAWIYLLCRATRTANKKDVVNACLFVFGLLLKKKKYQGVDVFKLPKEVAAKSQLQPNTVSKIHLTLFNIFKDNDVKYSLGDFKHDGSFYAVWNKKFDDTCKYRDDFGNKPYQTEVDLHNFQKTTSLVPPLQPEHSYTDMLLVCPYKIVQAFCLRAGQEASNFYILHT